MTEPSNSFTPHNRLTHPGRHAPAIDQLPADVPALLSIVRGLLLHCDYLQLYGVTAPPDARGTLNIEARLDQILAISPDPLATPRPYNQRAIGTCRDYALMMCSFLRHKQVPARLRCGFATYFTPGRYEDHWICEYWQGGWHRTDPQLDNEQQAYLDITFDTAKLPVGTFMSANEAWYMLQSDSIDAQLFGHGEARGKWYMWVNLARDCLALNGTETSDWDTWRIAAANPPVLSPDDLNECSRIAAHIQTLDQPPLHSLTQPFWRT